MANGVIIPTDTDMCPYLGSYSSTSDLYSALETVGNAMADREVKDVSFDCTAVPFVEAGHTELSAIYARIYRDSSGKYFVQCFNVVTSGVPVILLWKWSGGWARKTITLN